MPAGPITVPPKYKFEIYAEQEQRTGKPTGQFRWRFRATASKKILMDSGEAYSSKSNAKRSVLRLIELMQDYAGTSDIFIVELD
jgi:uncharacterized protein YegP (UPF0339 family)